MHRLIRTFRIYTFCLEGIFDLLLVSVLMQLLFGGVCETDKQV